jgi:hypothetical protein
MNMDDYPYCSLGEDKTIRSTGQHRLRFPQMLWDALIRLNYDGSIPEYHYRPIQAHVLNMCEVRVEISFDPTVLWMGAVIGSKLDDAVEKMAHIAVTSLCESRLAPTAEMPITLFSICDQEDLVWQ